MDFITIEFSAFTINIIMLSIAAYYDIKERLVSDLLWLIMLIPAVILLALRLLAYNNDMITNIMISIAVAITIAIIFSIAGLWGGADGLAIIMLILINPLSFNNDVIHQGNILIIYQIIPFSLNIIMNAYIIALLYPIGLFIYNVIRYKYHSYLYLEPIHIPMWQKLIVSFIGYPIRTENLENKNFWHYELLEAKNKKSLYFQQRIPLLLNLTRNQRLIPQKINLNRYKGIINSIKYNFKSKISIEDETIAIFRRLKFIHEIKEDNRTSVWIQYSLPFIVLILLGYIFAVLYGNIVLIIVDFLN